MGGEQSKDCGIVYTGEIWRLRHSGAVGPSVSIALYRVRSPRGRDDNEALTADLVAMAEQYGRYGYSKISALLRSAGWLVSDKRVGQIWRREGLKAAAQGGDAPDRTSRHILLAYDDN